MIKIYKVVTLALFTIQVIATTLTSYGCVKRATAAHIDCISLIAGKIAAKVTKTRREIAGCSHVQIFLAV